MIKINVYVILLHKHLLDLVYIHQYVLINAINY